MRRGILLGLGMSGALAAQSAAPAQFASDRPPPAPPAAPPAATTPPPTTPAPAPAPAAPPRAEKPQGTAHAWYVRPEYGPWMISIKSYSGPEAKKYAEALASEIRQTYHAGAYLFEWGTAQRHEEEERRQAARQKAMEQSAPFLQVQQQIKDKAAKEGSIFVETPAKFRYAHVEIAEQWAVLVGGFKDMNAAHAALTQLIRKWEPPKNRTLMEQAYIERPDGKGSESALLNPYKTAMVVPNPSAPKANGGQPAADPALAKLNEEEPLSLLKARKPWTLMVKRFLVPARVQGRENSVAVVDKLFGSDESAKMLEATAKQARSLASALRDQRMKPAPLDAFVLHGRTDSVVTVGQFDGPDDPALAETWKALNGMTFQVEYKDGRPAEYRKMFDAVIPMQVPKVQ